MTDAIQKPAHYQGAAGMQAFDVIRHMGLGWPFCVGNAVKYILRAGRKGDAVEDLEKARQYLLMASSLHQSEQTDVSPLSLAMSDEIARHFSICPLRVRILTRLSRMSGLTFNMRRQSLADCADMLAGEINSIKAGRQVGAAVAAIFGAKEVGSA